MTRITCSPSEIEAASAGDRRALERPLRHSRQDLRRSIAEISGHPGLRPKAAKARPAAGTRIPHMIRSANAPPGPPGHHQ